MTNNRYTEAEDDYIRQHYGSYTISRFLKLHTEAGFPTRTWSGIKHRAALLNLGRYDRAVESVALPPTVRLPLSDHFAELRSRGLKPTRIDSKTVVFGANPLSAESRQRYRQAANPNLKEHLEANHGRGRRPRKYC